MTIKGIIRQVLAANRVTMPAGSGIVYGDTVLIEEVVEGVTYKVTKLDVEKMIEAEKRGAVKPTLGGAYYFENIEEYVYTKATKGEIVVQDEEPHNRRDQKLVDRAIKAFREELDKMGMVIVKKEEVKKED